jgi:hypothetical protein
MKVYVAYENLDQSSSLKTNGLLRVSNIYVSLFFPLNGSSPFIIW